MRRNFISHSALFLSTFCTASLPGTVRAAPDPADVSTAFKKVLDCQNVADSAARLACYDKEVSAIDAARARQEVVIIDRTQVSKARKSLFGLNLPDLGLFGGKDDDSAAEEEGVGYIKSTIVSARAGPDRKWIFELEGGARWTQSEGKSIPDLKPGQSVVIRKAALGSFMANINDRPAIRVKRLN